MPVVRTAALNSPAVSRLIASPESLPPRSPGSGDAQAGSPQAITRSQDPYQSIRVPVLLLVKRFLSASFRHCASARLGDGIRFQQRAPGQPLAELAHLLPGETAHQFERPIDR